MLKNHTPTTRWSRADTVAQVTKLEVAKAKGTSQRSFAQAHHIPRSTLQYWQTRKHGLDSSPALIAFFESPDGLAFLHRLVLALQFVMTFVGDCGLRLVQEVVQLAGLEPFVANSLHSRQQCSVEMETAIRRHANQERARLAKDMTPRDIAACADETFHPEICLVAIEPVSNFILLEQYAERRDASTWKEALNSAIEGLPVQITQVTSDEGKGLVAHVRQGLGAHHTPDLFHIQQELSRATAVALASQVRQAAEKVERAAPDPDRQLAAVVQASERQERARTAIRGLSQACHPIDLQTGAWRDAHQVEHDCTKQMNEIQAVAIEAALPERCGKGLAKAQRVLPAMIQTIAFFHQQVARQFATLKLAAAEIHLVKEFLLPAAYLARVADKAPTADIRHPIRQQAEQLYTDAQVLLATVEPEQRQRLERVAQNGADLFQRSSSCVEGRNGQLALRHHSLHTISDTRLEALTAVHNYFLKHPDGTTAAERFFGSKPANLFHWLLDHLNMPARPAKKRTPERHINIL